MSGLATWVLESRPARSVGITVACLSGTGTVLAGSAGTAALVTDRPVADVLPLLPIMVVLHVWVVAVSVARRKQDSAPDAASREAAGQSSRFRFGDEVPSVVAVAIWVAVAMGVFIQAVTIPAVVGAPDWKPEPVIMDRLVAGLLTLMFAVQVAIVLGGLPPRRNSHPDPVPPGS